LLGISFGVIISIPEGQRMIGYMDLSDQVISIQEDWKGINAIRLFKCCQNPGATEPK